MKIVSVKIHLPLPSMTGVNPITENAGKKHKVITYLSPHFSNLELLFAKTKFQFSLYSKKCRKAHRKI